MQSALRQIWFGPTSATPKVGMKVREQLRQNRTGFANGKLIWPGWTGPEPVSGGLVEKRLKKLPSLNPTIIVIKFICSSLAPFRLHLSCPGWLSLTPIPLELTWTPKG